MSGRGTTWLLPMAKIRADPNQRDSAYRATRMCDIIVLPPESQTEWPILEIGEKVWQGAEVGEFEETIQIS